MNAKMMRLAGDYLRPVYIIHFPKMNQKCAFCEQLVQS